MVIFQLPGFYCKRSYGPYLGAFMWSTPILDSTWRPTAGLGELSQSQTKLLIAGSVTLLIVYRPRDWLEVGCPQ